MPMGPTNGPSNLFKLSAEGGYSGGGDNSNGGQSSQADSHLQEEQASQEADRAFENLPQAFKDLLANPTVLATFMSAHLSILNHYPQFTNAFKTEVLSEAFSRTKSTPAIPARVSDEARTY